jgi:hypothetical protein
MTTFDLWPIPLGGGAWCAGTNMWHPKTPASYESIPATLATQIPTLWIHTSGGRGRGGGALILYRCRAFDLFASVDAHLCLPVMMWNFNGLVLSSITMQCHIPVTMYLLAENLPAMENKSLLYIVFFCYHFANRGQTKPWRWVPDSGVPERIFLGRFVPYIFRP